MATLMFCRTFGIKSVKPHVPLIKFRKGGISDGGHHSKAGASASPAPAASKSKGKAIARPILEDYQLPLKYRRQPIDQREIDAINSGGVL